MKVHLHLGLLACGVGPGDEVITCAYTYTATASVTCHVGAKVVMVDTAPGSFEMDYGQAQLDWSNIEFTRATGGALPTYIYNYTNELFF